MPTWLKVVICIVSVVIVLLGAAGFAVVRAFDSGKKAAERARIEGKIHGEYGTLEGCVEEGVRRTADCESTAVQCIFTIDAFMWSCLEAAPYEQAFCDRVPAAGDAGPTAAWSSAACARYGLANHEQCRFNLSVVAPFCSSRDRT